MRQPTTPTRPAYPAFGTGARDRIPPGSLRNKEVRMHI